MLTKKLLIAPEGIEMRQAQARLHVTKLLIAPEGIEIRKATHVKL